MLHTISKLEEQSTVRVQIMSTINAIIWVQKKGKRKGELQSQTAALTRHQEEEETDKTKQAQIEQTYEKH